jgi:hypothetical protein
MQRKRDQQEKFLPNGNLLATAVRRDVVRLPKRRNANKKKRAGF